MLNHLFDTAGTDGATIDRAAPSPVLAAVAQHFRMPDGGLCTVNLHLVTRAHCHTRFDRADRRYLFVDAGLFIAVLWLDF